jgi:hypothetical protein
MGKRKARGSQHHEGNQTSGGDFHAKKYMPFQPQPTAIGFTGLRRHSTVSGPSNIVRLITSVRATCGP